MTENILLEETPVWRARCFEDTLPNRSYQSNWRERDKGGTQAAAAAAAALGVTVEASVI